MFGRVYRTSYLSSFNETNQKSRGLIWIWELDDFFLSGRNYWPNFWASKSSYRLILCSSETPVHGFRGSGTVKSLVGMNSTYPTDPFTTLQLQNPSLDRLELPISRSLGSKIVKGSVGSACYSFSSWSNSKENSLSRSRNVEVARPNIFLSRGLKTNRSAFLSCIKFKDWRILRWNVWSDFLTFPPHLQQQT